MSLGYLHRKTGVNEVPKRAWIVILFVLLVFFQCACDNESKSQAHTIRQSEGKTEDNSQYSTQVEDSLGNGFRDHGVAVPFATSRGTVAAVDADGHNVILTWLYDHRGTYSLLMIDTNQEKSQQFMLPFNGHSYTSILSNKNKYYTHFDGHFIEFSPSKPGFTFIGKTSQGSAMSMTEDDNGIIWAALQPDSRLISYNPRTRELTDHGIVYDKSARQLPTSIATDDAGWVYIVAGPPGEEQIVAFNPATEKHYSMLVEPTKGLTLFRSENGKVYRKDNKNIVAEFYEGKENRINVTGLRDIKPYITGNQSLFYRTFPDGNRIADWVSASSTGFLGKRQVTIDNPNTGESREIAFNYQTEGPGIMGIAASPEGKIIGGTNFPMVFFQYDPNNGTWDRHGAYGQFNTLEVEGDKLFIGAYPRGDLLVWDSRKEWVPTHEGKELTNPNHLAKAYPFIIRPHDLLAYPDGNTIIMAGRPSGGRTSGGLLFWNQAAQKADLLEQVDGIPNQSTQSLAALPNGKILGGTTVKPGDSGGMRVAKEAELYIMDLNTHKITWSQAVITGANSYQDLYATASGMIFGVADFDKFFVFDTNEPKLLKQVNLPEAFGSGIPYTQGQRSFVKGPKEKIYLLLQKGILKIDTENLEVSFLVESPVNITGGGAYLDGRIYFIGNGRSRIYSYTPNG